MTVPKGGNRWFYNDDAPGVCRKLPKLERASSAFDQEAHGLPGGALLERGYISSS